MVMMLTTLPCTPAFFMALVEAWVSRKGARQFTAKSLSHDSTVCVARVPLDVSPAELQRPSGGPNSLTCWGTTAWTEDTEAMSHWTNWALQPRETSCVFFDVRCVCVCVCVCMCVCMYVGLWIVEPSLEKGEGGRQRATAHPPAQQQPLPWPRTFRRW